MQICLLSAAEAQRLQDPGFVPACDSHKHLSKRDADRAVAEGNARFINHRAVVTVGPVSLSGYWYDSAVQRNDRYLGTAKSGGVCTRQLVNFMPRAMKHKTRDLRACGARSRSMNVKVVNAFRQAMDHVGIGRRDDEEPS